ncbi:MAG TPA: response regulator [Puia sp.]|jgi:CheY-like chemotaxis protein|nr:response regulator [Puia sp.]
MTHKKILLVDDDIDDRLIFAELLSATDPDARLTFAENGLEMVDLLEKTTEPDLPDMIILDQNMPKMTGKESLVFLKESQRYRHIPTFIYSTYQVRDFYQECLQLGAQDVLAKPDTMQDYREMIERFLLHPAHLHTDDIESLGSRNE